MSRDPNSAPMDQPVTPLNVFALPARTTLLFGLIVLVIVLPIFAAFGSGSPVCAPVLLFGIVLLPLRDFLRKPRQSLADYHAVDARADFPNLVREWERLATTVAKIKPPRLLITRHKVGAFTFGSFTRHYLMMPEALAAQFEHARLPADPQATRARAAMLLHELAHFVHHDVWMAQVAESILRVTMIFMTLSWVVNTLTPLLYNRLIVFFDFSRLWSAESIGWLRMFDAEMATALTNPPLVAPQVWMRYEVFVFTAHLPLVIGSAILLMFYWRALLRTRELYADARVARWQGDADALWRQLIRAQVAAAIRPAPNQVWKRKWGEWINRVRGVNVLGLDQLKNLFSAHPALKTRRACLDAPHTIYGNEMTIGITAGVTVVLLNLTLSSLFLSRYLRGPNSGVPFLIGFAVIALSLLPSLCQFPEHTREYSRKVTRAVWIFTGIKLIPQFILGALVALGVGIDPALIDQAAYTLVPGADANLEPTGVPVEFVLEFFVLRPAILFAFGMPLGLILFLRLDARIKRWLLRLYSAPFMARSPVAGLWASTGVLTLILGLLIVPILDALTVPTAHDLSDPLTILGILVALGLGGASGIFFKRNERFADRCPRCGARASGEYRLGKTCVGCGELFHPQLCAPANFIRQ